MDPSRLSITTTAAKVKGERYWVVISSCVQSPAEPGREPKPSINYTGRCQHVASDTTRADLSLDVVAPAIDHAGWHASRIPVGHHARMALACAYAKRRQRYRLHRWR